MAAITPDSMVLETMRKEDDSWHPCRISLSSGDGDVGIIVDLGTDEEDDLICNKEDVLSRLRFRSTPLQGDDCANIKEGQCVLALQKTMSKSLFIDATIEKPKRVKHSKRVHCRCTFEIKWLNSELKGETTTVPSKFILKLSERAIDEHHIFSRFLNALSSENGANTPSVVSFSEESTCEAEFIGILEKQVEEISKLVDGSKSSFADLFSEEKNASGGKQKSKAKENSSQRFFRNQNKSQLETEAGKEAEVRKDAEIKPVLTPLAARAALASMVHDLPENSPRLPEEQDLHKRKDSQHSDATETTELSAIATTSNSVKSTPHYQKKLLLAPNSSKKSNNNTSTASPNRHSTAWKRKSRDSSNMSGTQEKEIKPSGEIYTDVEDDVVVIQQVSDSVNGDRVKTSANTRRITRSAKKESEVTSFISKQDSPTETLRNSQNSARLAHLSAPKEANKSSISKSLRMEAQHELHSPNGVKSAKSANPIIKRNSNNEPAPIAENVTAGLDHNETRKNATEKNESTTKRRKRLVKEDALGDEVKEVQSASKKSHASSSKDWTKLPLRSSPRLATSL